MAKIPLAPKHAGAELDLSPSRLVQLEQIGELTSLRDSLGRRQDDPDVIAAFKRKREARRERERS